MRLAILVFCLVACSAESPVVQRLYQATLPVKGPPAPAIHPFGGGPRGSPVQLASIDARTYAWVADADASVMRIVDLDALELVSTLPLGGEPSEMVMFEDGSVAVALRDTSELLRITAGTKPSIRARIDIATEPLGLALTNETLLVASGWGRTLTAVATRCDRRRATRASRRTGVRARAVIRTDVTTASSGRRKRDRDRR